MYFTAAFALICQNTTDITRLTVSLVICLTTAIPLHCDKAAAATVPIALLMAVINPFFNHTGTTVLFEVNELPYTLESLIRGLCSAELMVTLVLWFSLAVRCIDEQRLFSLLSRALPTVSLMLSMTMRTFRDLNGRLYEINACQSSFFSGKPTLRFRVKTAAGVFLSALANGLEGSVIRGVSMNARGFSNRKKTSVYSARFIPDDLLFLPVAAILVSGFIFDSGIFLYLALCVPIVYSVKEELRWRFLKSKI